MTFWPVSPTPKERSLGLVTALGVRTIRRSILTTPACWHNLRCGEPTSNRRTPLTYGFGVFWHSRIAFLPLCQCFFAVFKATPVKLPSLLVPQCHQEQSAFSFTSAGVKKHDRIRVVSANSPGCSGQATHFSITLPDPLRWGRELAGGTGSLWSSHYSYSRCVMEK